MVIDTINQNSGCNAESTVQFLSKNEIKEYKEVFPEVIEQVIKLTNDTYAGCSDMDQMVDWMTNVIQYNVSVEPNCLGGILVPAAYKAILKEGVSPADMKLSYVLGWGLEISHSTRDISDNIMDKTKSTKTGNKPAWHTVGSIGMKAINDVFVLGSVYYNVIKIFFKSHPFYHQIQDAIQDGNQKNILGRGLWEQMEKQKDIVKSYTMGRYRQVVNFMDSYYTFYLPFKFTLIMAGRNEEELELALKELMLQIGYYSQLINQFENIFGSNKQWVENATGKMRRRTWFFVKALNVANEKATEELFKLVENKEYEPEIGEQMRKFYVDLGLLEMYSEEKRALRCKISEEIANLSKDHNMSEDIFHSILAVIEK